MMMMLPRYSEGVILQVVRPDLFFLKGRRHHHHISFYHRVACEGHHIICIMIFHRGDVFIIGWSWLWSSWWCCWRVLSVTRYSLGSSYFEHQDDLSQYHPDDVVSLLVHSFVILMMLTSSIYQGDIFFSAYLHHDISEGGGDIFISLECVFVPASWWCWYQGDIRLLASCII